MPGTMLGTRDRNINKTDSGFTEHMHSIGKTAKHIKNYDTVN